MKVGALLQMLGRAGRGQRAGRGTVVVRSSDAWDPLDLVDALTEQRIEHVPARHPVARPARVAHPHLGRHLPGDPRDQPPPRQQPHAWLFNQRNLINNVAAMRKYAAETSAIDDGVGAVLAALDRLQLDRKSVV